MGMHVSYRLCQNLIIMIHVVMKHYSAKPSAEDHYTASSSHASTSMLARAKGVTTRKRAAHDYVISSMEQYHICISVHACCVSSFFWHTQESQEANLLVCYNQ